jgi:NitT/TauT family transport system substrate-binding protein
VKGFFLQDGLEVNAQKYPLGKFALQAVLEGKADIATVAETPFMLAVMKGEDIAIIATIQRSKNNYTVIARRDRGIHSPQDLKGKKVGVSLGTSGDYFLDAFMGIHGISRSSIKVSNLKPDALLEAIVNGDVDAIATLPFVLIQSQKKLGNRAVTFDSENVYTQFFNVVARREFVRRNPGMVNKLLRALVKAEEYVSRNNAEVQKIVADFSGINFSTVREGWDVNDFEVSCQQSLILALEDESRWAINSGLTKAGAVPNYLDHIYLDGLRSVKPEAVRILR